MLIFYGLKDKNSVIAHAKNPEVCGNCSIPAYHQVEKKKTFFTLFFIPILPVHTKYTLVCTCCGYSRKIKKAEAMNYVNDRSVGTKAS